ncbi:UNVERIFIED_CONTAM: Lecithin-cholesterol acyltransferase-like 1 [Sesamum radiatum]|uniref:Lecithin-cholesterol acyltransferase-like 1 n=1 Tax=Sesamum radiatum TaxID=300843 RepID=A0AAW2M1R1_SESRA
MDWLPKATSNVGSKFLSDLKNLIESTSNSNGGRPVILLSHSLGGLFVLQFLDRIQLLGAFLQDIGFPEGVRPYKTRVLPLVQSLPNPQVPVTCIFGGGVKTPETLFYGDCGFDKRPEVVYGDGDGTVNMVSLMALESAWDSRENQSLKVIKIPGVSHTSILKDGTALDRIISEISSINYEISTSLLR